MKRAVAVPASTFTNAADSQPQLLSTVVRRAYWSVLALVVILHLVAVWLPSYNTLVDYPFHLARAWVLHTYDQDPFLRQIFVRDITPMPNLALDLIVPPLLNILPVVTAGKVFLSLIVLLFAAGCHGIAVVIYGRINWMAPLAVFAVFNSAFLYGFVNSTFSTSMFLVTFAVWLRFRHQWTASRLIAAALLATLTYLSHLSGFAFLALAAGVFSGIEVLKLRQIQAGQLVGLSILLPGILIQLYPWANKVHIGGEVAWGNPARKLISLASVFIGFKYYLTIITLLLLATALVWLVWRERVAVNQKLFLAGATFVLAALICPSQLTSGGGSAADARFVPPATVLILLSVGAFSLRPGVRLALSIAFAAMLLRLGDVGWHLSKMSLSAEKQLAALTTAPQHSRIYEIFLRPQDREKEKVARGNLHVPSYSLIFTQSVSSDFYAERGAQPLYFRNPEDGLVGAESPASFEQAYLDSHLPRYDHVWACNLDDQHRSYLQSRARLLTASEQCSLWKLSARP